MDKRLRVSVLVSDLNAGRHLVVDTGPDFRQQMLSVGIDRLDGILLTHEHNDHVIGIDDVRPFNFRSRKDMPVYGLERVVEELKGRFSYAFKASPYPGVPRLKTYSIFGGTSFSIEGIEVQAIDVIHGKLPILGFRFGEFTYITDGSQLSEETLKTIRGTKYLLINALRKEPHHSHFHLDQALEIIEQINPDRAWLTHISHVFGKTKEINPTLPDNVKMAYDGLTFPFRQ